MKIKPAHIGILFLVLGSMGWHTMLESAFPEMPIMEDKDFMMIMTGVLLICMEEMKERYEDRK